MATESGGARKEGRSLRARLIIGSCLFAGPIVYFCLIELGVLPAPDKAFGDGPSSQGYATGVVLGSLLSIATGLATLGMCLKEYLRTSSSGEGDSLLVRMNNIQMSPMLAVLILAVLLVLFAFVGPLIFF